MKSKIKIAVVGLGFGRHFVPIYKHHPDVAEVAIVEMNEERLRTEGDFFEIDRRFRTLDEAVSAKDIDAIHLLTGIPGHAAQSLSVLASGKHCACAIPMATALEDVQAIVAAEKSSGKNYMMMETELFSPQLFFCQEKQKRGDFGRVQHLRGWHYQDMENWPSYWAGFPPMWYGQHALAPLVALAQSRPVKVHSFGLGEMRRELHAPYGNPFPAETAFFELEGTSLRAEVTRSLFNFAHPMTHAFSVYGDDASFEGMNGKLYRQGAPIPGKWGRDLSTETPEIPAFAERLPSSIVQFTQRFVYGKNASGEDVFVGGGPALVHMAHEFVRSIVESRPASCGALKAAELSAACLAAHESALAGGKEIAIPKFS